LGKAGGNVDLHENVVRVDPDDGGGGDGGEHDQLSAPVNAAPQS
jgi:hypothetical protein